MKKCRLLLAAGLLMFLTGCFSQPLGLPHSDVFRQAKDVAESDRGFSLAQKMVGRACGVKGVSLMSAGAASMLDTLHLTAQSASVSAALRQGAGAGNFEADLEYLRALQETLERTHGEQH